MKQEQAESQAKEPAPRPKPEATAPRDHVQRMPASRDNDSHVLGQQQEISSNQREEKSVFDSRRLKEVHQKLTEKHSAVQAQLDAQVRLRVNTLGCHRLGRGQENNFFRERNFAGHCHEKHIFLMSSSAYPALCVGH